MNSKFRLTSTGWAQVIRSQLYALDYLGIQRLDVCRVTHALPTLAQVLTNDEWYMERLHDNEVDSFMADDASQEDWEEHVAWYEHRKGSCPHGDPQEQQAYEEAYQAMLADNDARRTFFSDRIDWRWIHDFVTEWTTNSLGCIAAFVREHPVTAVWQARNEVWIDIDQVKAFCPECGEPIDEYEGPISPSTKPHCSDYSGPCELCNDHEGLGEHMECFYDRKGNLRPLLDCPDCGLQFTDDDLNGSFVENFGYPATWPRDAPYPPRRGFLGEPMDVVPWET